MNNLIPEYVTRVLDALTDAGFEAFLVGGCVRDAALGTAPHDFDATTSALPEEMLRIFADFHVIETGLKHGTLTVMSDGIPVEVTTYRIDGEYLDNRHPSEVRFTRSITEDLSRRDFTVNAMAYSPKIGLCDPFGGMRHLREGRLVCVGAPEDRFAEDGLRILRALRFSSVLDFEIEEDTAAAVREMHRLLDNISRERIFSELKKLLCGAGVGRILSEYPEVLSRCVSGTAADDFRRASALGTLSQDPIVRLAYVFMNSTADTAAAMRALKASGAEIKRCVRLTAEAGDAASPYPRGKYAIRRLMSRLDGEDILAYAELKNALTGKTAEYEAFLAAYREAEAESPCVKVSSLAVNGADVMNATGAQGTAVGRILATLLDDVMSDTVPNTRSHLLTHLKNLTSRKKTE